jgi:2-polyprenyl-6-methoxyphenol hydroxylase-like FAD-dependent oxidoreductase
MMGAPQRSTSASDILILGTGPAACLAASRLARTGREIRMIGRPALHERIEGASPRVVELLQGEGVPMDAFAPARQRRVHWGTLPGSPNVEHVVNRARLDAALLDMSRAAGVNTVEVDITKIGRNRIETGVGAFEASRLRTSARITESVLLSRCAAV